MTFSEMRSKPVPSWLVLQTEAMLVQFEPQTALAADLETTTLCDCGSVVMYSSAKGVAYLSHIYFKEMDTLFDSYKNSIEKIIKNYDLNNENTVVALIGGQDKTSTWIGAFEKLLLPHFKDLKKEVGGSSNTERSVELTLTAINIIKMPYSNPLKISYQSFPFNKNISRSRKFSQIEYFVNGTSYFVREGGQLDSINAAINDFETIVKDPPKFVEMENKIEDEIKRRMLLTDNLTGDRKYMMGTTVSKMRRYFDLQEGNPYETCTQILNCAIRKPMLFSFLKKNIKSEELRAFTYDDINRFRFPVIQKYMEKRELSSKQVKEMSSEIEEVLHSATHYKPLINTLGIEQLISHKKPKELNGVIFKIDDLLSTKKIGPKDVQTLTITDINRLYDNRDSLPLTTDIEEIEIDQIDSPLASPRKYDCSIQ